MASKDFRSPYTQQGDIAIEHQLTKTLALTASYIWSRGLHLTSVNDINIGAPGPTVTYRINDASGNQVGSYSTPVYVRQNRVDHSLRAHQHRSTPGSIAGTTAWPSS